ncbi:DUF2892 domain-containing protein [Variovorax robiniae]|uniref:DUF2892 domain-containing protein n=1 Tax=Variovorax robiniae TaxID=1836199 RepID=A0ABU8XAJ9_9BURK
MKTNLGTIDRALRIIVGLLLLALTGNGTIGLWGWVGLVPLITGLAAVCPAYTIFGLSTCSSKTA